MMYSACASKVIPGTSHRFFKPSPILNAGIGASSQGIDHELPTKNISSLHVNSVLWR